MKKGDIKIGSVIIVRRLSRLSRDESAVVLGFEKTPYMNYPGTKPTLKAALAFIVFDQDGTVRYMPDYVRLADIQSTLAPDVQTGIEKTRAIKKESQDRWIREQHAIAAREARIATVGRQLQGMGSELLGQDSRGDGCVTLKLRDVERLLSVVRNDAALYQPFLKE